MSTEPVDTAAIRRGPLSRAYLASPDLADTIDALCDEVDRLTATLDRVRALHKPLAYVACSVCRFDTGEEYLPEAWPCPTIRALDA